MSFDQALAAHLFKQSEQQTLITDRSQRRDRHDRDRPKCKPPENSGMVVLFNSERGYGLVSSDQDDTRLFFHVTAWAGPTEPRVGDRVRFDVGERKGGKRIATNVRAALSTQNGRGDF